LTVKASTLLGVKFVKLVYQGWEPAQERQLLTLLSAWSRVEDRMNSDGDLTPVDEVPGYLHTKDAKGISVFVPINLVRVSPSRAQRSEIHNLALGFTLQPDIDYCLSGSGTFLGVTNLVGDIDLAEYASSTWQNIEQRIVEIREAGQTPQKGMQRLTIVHPTGQSRQKTCRSFPKIQKCLSASRRLGWNRIYLEGYADLSGIYLGLKDMTNMVFPVRSRDETSDSFVLQEIVLTDDPSGRPPRSFLDRAQTAGYLDFLELEARKYLDGFQVSGISALLVKSLKRVLSLILLLGDRTRFTDGLSNLTKTENLGDLDTARISDYVTDTLQYYVTCRTKAGAMNRGLSTPT